MTIREIIDDAYLQCGLGRPETGDQIRIAMTALKLLQRDWDNRQPNQFQYVEWSLALDPNVISYSLTSDTIGLMEVSRRDSNGYEILLREISMSEYQQITSKTQTGPPVQYMVIREAQNPQLYVWPLPSDSSYSLTGWRLSSSVNSSPTVDQSLSIPPAMEAPLSCGLAYFLAKRNLDKVPLDRLALLKADYDESWARAKAADTHKTDMVYARTV